MVEKGEGTIEEATAQADALEAYASEIIGRGDITPEVWQSYEEA